MRHLLIPTCAVLVLGCHTPLSEHPSEEVKRAAAAPGLPRTLPEAVESILSRMPADDRVRLRETPQQDLIGSLHAWGRGIRNEFQLWGGNDPLLMDCGTDSPERASRVIMEAVWDRLQKK